MNGRRAASLLLACLAVSVLVFGSGGFSSVTAERSLSVAVVDTDEAYVGVDATQRGQSGTLTVTVTNRFVEPLTVERLVVDGTRERSPDGKSSTVGVGDQRRYSVKTAGADTVRVRVTAEGFEATVTVPVETTSSKTATPTESGGTSGHDTTTTPD
jgi:hypothetical protein